MATLTAVEVPSLVIESSWDTYERILSENPERGGLRIAFDGKHLEFMVLSTKHEEPNRTLALIVEMLSEELGPDIRRVGSTTFRRRDKEAGFEPDSSYYVQNLAAVEGFEEIDLTRHPAPDLTIEVEVSRTAIDRFGIFETIGIPELWTVRDRKVTIFLLRENGYQTADRSLAFPAVTAADLSWMLGESFEKRSRVWARETRQFIRSLGAKS